MGVGKRPRGILITSVQPNSIVDGKLHIGDHILAVNYQPVLDQASAVNFIRQAGCEFPYLLLTGSYWTVFCFSWSAIVGSFSTHKLLSFFHGVQLASQPSYTKLEVV
ncbi:PDZ domain-containing protein [Trichinella pseudospiralis]